MNFEGTLEILGPAGRIIVAGRGACVSVSTGWRIVPWAVPRLWQLRSALRLVPVRTDFFIRTLWVATVLPISGGGARVVPLPSFFGYKR